MAVKENITMMVREKDGVYLYALVIPIITGYDMADTVSY